MSYVPGALSMQFNVAPSLSEGALEAVNKPRKSEKKIQKDFSAAAVNLLESPERALPGAAEKVEKSKGGKFKVSKRVSRNEWAKVKQTKAAEVIEKRKQEETRTLHLSNVPTSVTEQQLRDFLGCQPGEIEGVRFRSCPVARRSRENLTHIIKHKQFVKHCSTVHAYVVVSSEGLVLPIIKSKSTLLLHNNPIFIDKGLSTTKFDLFDRKRTVFIGKLPRTVTETELYNEFSKIGTVWNVRLPRDKETFEARGIAYIHFAERATVKAALQAAKTTEYWGRLLNVEPVQQKETLEQMPRGGSKGGKREKEEKQKNKFNRHNNYKGNKKSSDNQQSKKVLKQTKKRHSSSS